ncbi:hypothetical protein SKAU_G00383520 [Synaphobranchus kaupii]|uniref:Uncharacterized protein n=1 Tax=Synaphobranchus kaupii TaxID=118154 RepID=A0A9Q1EE27_SYNKA|nr:hypothetical protein SKAU_G00383520 [Synaphobranchus kaupii]
MTPFGETGPVPPSLPPFRKSGKLSLTPPDPKTGGDINLRRQRHRAACSLICGMDCTADGVRKDFLCWKSPAHQAIRGLPST